MRDASNEDSLELLVWRNEPDVRIFSHNQSPISAETHANWLKKRLTLIQNEPFLAFSKSSEKIGFTRFDEGGSKNTYRVAILINPTLRGKGYGKLILALSIQHCLAKNPDAIFQATIHKGNFASQDIFSKNGFRESKVEGDFIVFDKSLF